MAAILKNALDPFGLTKDDDMGMVFVTSGSNVIGHRVAKGLLEAGYKHVRVGIWMGERQKAEDSSIGKKVREELEAMGATVVTFDIMNEEQCNMALAGINTAFCTLPHMDNFAEPFPKFLEACKKAHVRHFIKTSCFRAGEVKEDDPYYLSVPFVQSHWSCDDLVEKKKMDSRMTYTILCASHLMSNVLISQGPVLREEHKYITASQDSGVNYVSPNDIAEAAVNALVNRKKHRNKVYNFSGPRHIKDKSVADLLSTFYGSEIEHVPIGIDEYGEELTKRGYPDWYVKNAAAIEQVKASGIEERISFYTPDLEELIGKKPEGFEDYLAKKGKMTLQESPTPLED